MLLYQSNVSFMRHQSHGPTGRNTLATLRNQNKGKIVCKQNAAAPKTSL